MKRFIKLINDTLKKIIKNKDKEQIGYYVCELLDILGQKSELNKLNEIISLRVDQNEALTIFKNTYGGVKDFRKQIYESNKYFNVIAKPCNDSSQIKSSFFSDLIISYLSLSKNGKDTDICRLYYMLVSLSEVFLNMLAKGIALRGGIDVGYAIESYDDKLYGNALSKAIVLSRK